MHAFAFPTTKIYLKRETRKSDEGIILHFGKNKQIKVCTIV